MNPPALRALKKEFAVLPPQGPKRRNIVHIFLHFSGVASAAVFAAFALSAVAEETTSVWTCQSIGGGGIEPVGDREGHAILVSKGGCRIDGGPLSGGVSTDVSVWEWNGPKAVRLSVTGVVRKSDAAVV